MEFWDWKPNSQLLNKSAEALLCKERNKQDFKIILSRFYTFLTSEVCCTPKLLYNCIKWDLPITKCRHQTRAMHEFTVRYCKMRLPSTKCRHQTQLAAIRILNSVSDHFRKHNGIYWNWIFGIKFTIKVDWCFHEICILFKSYISNTEWRIREVEVHNFVVIRT